MRCVDCNSVLSSAAWSKGRVVPVRCRRCGTVHSSYDGSRISPVMDPLERGRRLSPWMLGWTRPLIPGTYECRFRCIEPVTIYLYWNGKRFTFNNEAVRMRTFLTWRGIWRVKEEENSDAGSDS